MHVPDGFLDAPTSLVTGAIATAGIAVALRGARRELDDRTAPMPASSRPSSSLRR
jgi:cobalt/nickel transport system permease protein